MSESHKPEAELLKSQTDTVTELPDSHGLHNPKVLELLPDILLLKELGLLFCIGLDAANKEGVGVHQRANQLL